MEPSIWSWAALILSPLILLAGFMTGRQLSGTHRTEHIRKFAALGAIPIILLLLLPRPFVSPSFQPDRPPVESVIPTDDLAQTLTQQAREIRLLENEVHRLRDELAKVNDYYGSVTSMILIAALVICVVYPLRKRKEDSQQGDRSPLGLNDDDNE